MIGRTLSHYKIVAELGRSGMGEVYRARDTKLKREVVIQSPPRSVRAGQGAPRGRLSEVFEVLRERHRVGD